MKSFFYGLTGIILLASFTKKEGKEASAQHVKWLPWNTGIELAKDQEKIALIDVYTDWCGYCKKMDRTTYSNRSIIKNINENFVAIKLNPEIIETYVSGKDTLSGQQLVSKLSNGQGIGYPTTFFYLPQHNQVVSQPGYLNEETMKIVLEKVLDYNERLKS